MLNKLCIIYIDNILIYINFKKKYQTYIQKILAALQKVGLQVNIDKYEFHITKISYLRLIIYTKGICMDSKKVETV